MGTPHTPPATSPGGDLATLDPTGTAAAAVDGTTVLPVGYRILITTATGRQIAAGGRFTTPDEAATWATGMTRHGAKAGEIVETTPEGMEVLSKYNAAAAIRADERQAILDAAARQATAGGDPLLDVDQIAELRGIKRRSLIQMIHHGHAPPADEGTGALSRWHRSTWDRWDAESPLRRRRATDDSQPQL